MNNEVDILIKKYEDTYSKLEEAEKVIKWCGEVSESYFKYGRKTEANDMRYKTIIKIVQDYFTNKKKGEKNENRGVQSKHN